MNKKYQIQKDPSSFPCRYFILEDDYTVDGTITLWGARRKIRQLKKRRIIE